MRLALFVTCLGETFTPRAAAASVLVLEHLGHEVAFPAGQTCCGQPMFNNGFHDEARAIGGRMLELFAGHDAVVTPSGSCAAMVRAHLPELFHGRPEATAAADLAARTFEFAEFLTTREPVDLAALGVRWEGTLTWHEACHLRELGRRGTTEALLRTVPGAELRPPSRVEQCCGFGGTFATSYPDVSARMVADRVEAVADSGAAAVVASDAGCAMNVEGACHRAGLAPRFLHVAELLAEGLGLMPRPDAAGGREASA